MPTDLLGRPLDPLEERLLAAYEELKALCEAPLPPVALANVRQALAVLSNAVNGLLLEHEHLIDLGL